LRWFVFPVLVCGGVFLAAAPGGSYRIPQVYLEIPLLSEEDRPETMEPDRQTPFAEDVLNVPVDSEPVPEIVQETIPPRQAYAIPFEQESLLPRVAFIVTGLGQNADVTRAAIDTLPPYVALAFLPFAPDVAARLQAARDKGHEVILQIPMEPKNFPREDPGPQALMAMAGEEVNLKNLDAFLSKGTGFFGVMPYMGGRFAIRKDLLEPVLARLADAGYVYLDPYTFRSMPALAGQLRIPFVSVDVDLDEDPQGSAVSRRFEQLAGRAKYDGRAVGTIRPYPRSVERLKEWLEDQDFQGLELVPVSSLARIDDVDSAEKPE
jgi:polysaccharide deacetylase 2 family uncharacterized protein YibQ